MAVVMATATDQTYQGLSSDPKPTGAGNGAIFHIVDTGEVYVFHEGVWTPDLRMVRALKNVF
jgi:hypothetical protein